MSLPLRLWAASWRLVLFVGVFLALYLPFVLPFILYPDTEYTTLRQDTTRTGIEFLAMLCVALAAVAMTRYADRRPLAHLGLGHVGAIRSFGLGSLSGAGMVALVIGGMAAWGFVTCAPETSPPRNLLWTTVSLLCNTIYQETLIRGYVQQMVRSYFGPAAAVVASSMLFVLLHWTILDTESILVLTNLFAASVLFGIAFLLGRNLWWPIGIHFGWNYLQGPLLGLPVTGVDLWDHDTILIQGTELLTGGSKGIEGGVLTSIVFVLVAALLWQIWRRRIAAAPQLEQAMP